jgi:hypothetical protein
MKHTQKNEIERVWGGKAVLQDKGLGKGERKETKRIPENPSTCQPGLAPSGLSASTAGGCMLLSSVSAGRRPGQPGSKQHRRLSSGQSVSQPGWLSMHGLSVSTASELAH